GVAGERLFVVANRFLGEVEGEHGADLRDLDGETFFIRGFADCGGELAAHFVESGVWVLRLEEAKGGDAGGHGERISAEGSGVINGAFGGEVIHDFATSAKSSDWESAADDFAHGGEVGDDFFAFLNAAGGDAESGHDFVENQERAFAGADFAELLEVVFDGENEADVG